MGSLYSDYSCSLIGRGSGSLLLRDEEGNRLINYLLPINLSLLRSACCIQYRIASIYFRRNMPAPSKLLIQMFITLF